MTSARTKHLVAGTLASCLVTVALFYSLVLLPQRKLVEAREKDLAEIRQTGGLAGRAVRDQAAGRLQAQIEASTRRLGDFVFKLPDPAKVASDITNISKTIGLSSFSIRRPDDDSASPASAGRAIGQICLDVSFAGSYGKFATFLNALERYRPVIFVDTFSITRSALGPSEHRANMRLPILVDDLPERMMAVMPEDSASTEEVPGTTDDATTVELGVGVGPVKFGMSKEQVILHLGQPDKVNGKGRGLDRLVSRGISRTIGPWNGISIFDSWKHGTGLSYAASKGISVAVSPYGGVSVIDCWSKKIKTITWDPVASFEGQTKEGIGMNASQEQVRTAYGKPDTTSLRGPTMILIYKELRTQFTFMNGRLVNIRMYAPE